MKKQHEKFCKTAQIGNCYQDCVEYMAAHVWDDIKPVLVHGIVANSEDGMPMGHAWIEKSFEFDYNDKLYIARMCLDCFDGFHSVHPVQRYYALGQIDEKQVIRYNHDQMNELLVQHGHYGPWELDVCR